MSLKTITKADITAYHILLDAGRISLTSTKDMSEITEAGNIIIVLAEKIKAERSLLENFREDDVKALQESVERLKIDNPDIKTDTDSARLKAVECKLDSLIYKLNLIFFFSVLMYLMYLLKDNL